MQQTQSQTDLEYGVMLALLNFHSEYLRSNYAHVSIDMTQDVIKATLTKTELVPAEERLAQTEQGRTLLQQVHAAMVASCAEVLKDRLARVLGRNVSEILPNLDPLTRRSHLLIRLDDPCTSDQSSDHRGY
jgi:uncharacterized protein YbcI